MKKMMVRAAVIAIFSAGVTGAVSVVAPGTAVACAAATNRSDHLVSLLPQLNYGDRGHYVVALQLALRKEGYDLRGTGTYAGQTLNAVRHYQKKTGIKNSGIVGPRTWGALVGSKDPRYTGNGEYRPPTFGVRPGERNEVKMRYLNNALTRIHPYTGKGAFSSTYDRKTVDMVQDFQRRAGIRASGIVGPRTWKAMYDVIAVTSNWGC